MNRTIPFLPLPYPVARPLLRALFPVSDLMEKFFPALEGELEESENALDPKEYVSGVLLSSLFYFLCAGAILGIYALRHDMLGSPLIRLGIPAVSFSFAAAIFAYSMVYPRWKADRRRIELDRDLLFAARHLMVQTSAGVPLFDSMVSVSAPPSDSAQGYGALGAEFGRVIKDVRAGHDFGAALDRSAERSRSPFYRRMMWQLSNAYKSGAPVGLVLLQIVEFLSAEQQIAIRNYGSQLNTMAMFYMMVCILAPTMGMVFLSLAGMFTAVALNDLSFLVILVLLIVLQVVFIGLIKSRRPTVSL